MAETIRLPQACIRIVGEQPQERFRRKQPQQDKAERAEKGENQPRYGDSSDLIQLSLAEPSGDQRVDADAGPDRDGNHQHLYRERDRGGGQGALAHLRHEDAVDDVVEGLNQHRNHQRQ